MLTFVYAGLFRYSFTQWLKPDYSHGFLVPFFAVYLAYHWRAWAPTRFRWPAPWGLAFSQVAASCSSWPANLNIAKEWLQGLSLILNLGASALLVVAKTPGWLAPSLAFLMFLFPLPHSVETKLFWQLQSVAAIASEFVLQTIGYPTYREGVVLLREGSHPRSREGVAQGWSMLLGFPPRSLTGMALVVKRPWFDRVLILVSAVPVAVLSNVIRIALTGVLYNEGGRELGDRVFHDFAGWMMMPIALVVLWAELKVLDWVWVDVGGRASQPRGDDSAERGEPGLPRDDRAAAGEWRDRRSPSTESACGTRDAAGTEGVRRAPPAEGGAALTAGRRAFAWLLLGVAAFVVYGSLVPFQFRALSLPDAVDSFRAALTAGVKIDSRSDSVANVMLGVPIGFALLGLVSVDRNWPREKIVLFALLLPRCGLFSAGVEFSQLFTVSRVCSASDIVAQVLGAAAGMVAWVLWGNYSPIARWRRSTADLNTASRLLIAYVGRYSRLFRLFRSM